MTTELPRTATCLHCSYPLRGLPENVCPECGHAFDPTDPTTYLPKPRAGRLRRWAPRLLTGVLIITLLYAFAPRRVMRGSAVFTCQHCGQVTKVERLELEPPPWIKLRYPAFTRRHETPTAPPAAAPTSACTAHHFHLRVQADQRSGMFCAGMSNPPEGHLPFVNKQVVTLDSAAALLESLMAFGCRGISVSTRLAHAPDDE